MSRRTPNAERRSFPVCPFFEQAGDQRRPAGLVAGAETPSGVAVEVLIEQDQVLAGGVIGVHAGLAIYGPPSLGILQEDGRQAPGEFPRHVQQVHPETSPQAEPYIL